MGNLLDTTQFLPILRQVFDIRRKHAEFARLTGENFNIFRILGLQSREVGTHSAFLRELLDPEGSHDQGPAFLELFLGELCINDFDLTGVRVETERKIGIIDKDFTEGGFIDLVITNENNECIIVENKIYAGDERNQLFRYYQYGHKIYGSNCRLFYLTLDGRPPQKQSTNDALVTNEHFRCISYSRHVRNWLEGCHRVSSNRPFVRETIGQYINLIKYLTQQNQNALMEQEIHNAITSNLDAFENARLIHASFPTLVTKIKQDVVAEMNHQLDQLGSRDVIFLGRYRIDYSIQEDNGFFLSFKAHGYPDGEIDNLTPDLQPVVRLIKKIDSKYKADPRSVGWKHTTFRTFNSNSKLQFELADPVYRRTFLAEVLREPIAHIQQLKEQMNIWQGSGEI